MHKYAYARLPPSILNTFTPLGTNNRTGNYLIPKYKTNFFERFPSVSLIKIWNAQKSEIKNCLLETSVKNKIKNNILQTYDMKVKCNYVDCPDC